MSDVKELWEQGPDRPAVPKTIIFYTTEQVARLFETTVESVKIWIHEGDLRAMKIGNRWRMNEADIEAFAASLYGGD